MIPNEVKIVADNIDDFTEISNGIAQLRKAVLTLAVSGKLVHQDIKDSTAKKLFDQIVTERAKLENGNIRRNKKRKILPIISKEEIPFKIPPTWMWVRFEETFSSVRGITFPGGDKSKEFEEGHIAVLRSGNVQDVLNFNNLLFVPEKHVRNSNQYLKTGDIIVSMANSRELVGKSSIVKDLKGKYTFGGFLSVFRPFLISPEYFQMVFSCDFVRARFFKDAKQVTNIANLSLSIVNLIPFPLPPLAEQKRIVKKVEEIMRKLDELEIKKQKNDEIRTSFTCSAMQSLGKGESKIALENITELIKTPKDIKELEGALLALAVSGNLVPQDKKDGTAEELYKKIQKEKVFKKQKNVIPILEKEIPFDIPKSWKWVRLAELGIINTGKTPKTASSENFNGDVPFIGPGDFGFGHIVSHSKLITEKGASESQYANKDDVLMVCIGGTIGKSALVDNPVTFNQQINKITLYDSIGKYLYYVFISKYFQVLVWSKTTGGATPILNSSRWSECLIPLPPVAEQKRIVKKVEEVMVLINQLRDVIGGSKSQGRGRPKK